MTVKELFEQLGELMYDQPDAAQMPIKVEMLIDSGLAWDDLAHVRQAEASDGVSPRVLVLSTEAS